MSGWGPAPAGGRFANRPYDRGGAYEGGGDAGAGGGGGPPSSALRTGFDRLRANGFGRWEWGMRWGTETPRAARPALGSRESGNDEGGCGGMRWREGLVSGWGPALAGGRFANRPYDRSGRTRAGVMRGLLVVRGGPFDRVKANGFGKRACGGEWRMRWGPGDRGCPAPRPCPGFPLSRERRVAGAVRRYQRGRDSPVRANVEPRPWETAHS